MPSYAVLGATGNTGQALINVLLQSPDKKVNAFCRSRKKLLRMTPSIADNKNVTVYEGQLEDVALLAECLRGTCAAFLVVAVPDNMPHCTIAQDTARVAVAAVTKLRNEGETVLPKLLPLSSAKLDDHLCRNMPGPMKWIVNHATSNQCKDLTAAQRFLLQQPEWISTTFIMPGGLCHDKQKGHKISMDLQETPLSYLDLAAGMVEVADDRASGYHMKNVAVVPTSKDVKFPYESLWECVKGLLAHYFPWTYHYTGAMPMPVRR